MTATATHAKTFTLVDGVTIAAGNSTESDVVRIYDTKSLMLTMRKTGDSTSVTYAIYTSPDGTDVDTEAYQTFSISGAGTKQLSRPITVGAHSMKVKVTNGGSASCVATVKFVPIYGR